MKAAIRQQINVLVRNISQIGIAENIKDTYIPTIWWDYRFVLDQETADGIKFALELPFVLQRIGVAICITGFLVLFTLITCNVPRDKEKNLKEPVLSVNDSPLLHKNCSQKNVQNPQ